jgi:hypothetical protein
MAEETSGRPVERTGQVKTYLADQLRELESQSVQGVLLIHVQRYDIMYLERTGDVISDIIKY